MKITALIDASGSVLGTMRRSGGEGGKGTTAMQVRGGTGQKTIDVDLPDDVLKGSVEEIHKAVERHLKK